MPQAEVLIHGSNHPTKHSCRAESGFFIQHPTWSSSLALKGTGWRVRASSSSVYRSKFSWLKTAKEKRA